MAVSAGRHPSRAARGWLPSLPCLHAMSGLHRGLSLAVRPGPIPTKVLGGSRLPRRSRRSTTLFLAISRPTIEVEEIDSVVDSLRSEWLTTGAKVLAFETAFRERLGVPHALAVNSATAGLHVVLAALDVGPGDEVITTSLTWASTVNVIELLGARPVFADVRPDTLLIDPEDVARRITERTRAVVPVHYAGDEVVEHGPQRGGEAQGGGGLAARLKPDRGVGREEPFQGRQ